MYAHERRQHVAALVAGAQQSLAAAPLSRDAVAGLAGSLEALAAKRHLWLEADYPSPDGAERQKLYLISEERDRSFAIYLSIMCQGRRVPPHNHTTWACIAAVEGCEFNQFYDRVDDGATPGHAILREGRQVRIEPGCSIALMPDDIHAVANLDAPMIRHLHFYGRALEVLDDRLIFDLAAGTCRTMVMDIPAIRPAQH